MIFPVRGLKIENYLTLYVCQTDSPFVHVYFSIKNELIKGTNLPACVSMISIDAGCCPNYKWIRLFHSHLSNILPDILQLH